MTRHDKHRVADRLGLQPARRHLPKETIIRVNVEWISALTIDVRGNLDVAALLPGSRRQDQSVQFFQAVATVAKPDGEPLQQLRVRRPAAVEAQVVRSVDQACAEVVMPDAVNDDSREERVVFMSDPRSELAPPLGFRGRWRKREVRVDARNGRDGPW